MARPKNPELPGLLLNAARDLVVERQGANFSLRELSARVGYTLTAIYRCFENREAMIGQLQLKLFAELNTYCTDGLAGSNYERVKQLGRRFVQWAVAHPAFFGVMFSDPNTGRTLGANDLRAARASYMFTTALLQMGKATGEFTVEEPEAAAVYLMASLQGMTAMALSGRLVGTVGENPVEFYDRYSDVMLTSLLTPNPPKT